MSEYDNTNRGAAFPPYEDQKFILSGDINYQGTDRRLVFISGSTKDGKKKIDVYQKMGVLFENDRKDMPAKPDYTGPIDNTNLRMAAWRNQKDGKPYLSYQVSEKQEVTSNNSMTQSPQENNGQAVDDDVPF